MLCTQLCMYICKSFADIDRQANIPTYVQSYSYVTGSVKPSMFACCTWPHKIAVKS